MKRIQIQTWGRGRDFRSELSTSLDLRDPEILRAKAISRSLHPQASVPSTLDRKEV
jgi:hypothetical protein